MSREQAISAYVQGGFGNQLFIYFAALAQARRLGCELELDTSWFEAATSNRHGDTPRTFLLNDFLGEHCPSTTSESGNKARLARVSQALRRAIYIDEPFGWQNISSRVIPGTRMIGYFQSAHYFDAIEPEVLERWQGYKHSTPAKRELAKLESQEFIAVHVRRGDYLKESTQNVHGLSTLDYFERSIGLARKLHGDLPVYLFTDSPEHVVEEFESVPNSTVFDQSSLNEPSAIRAISLANAIVMSNSSFSWWAAYLLTKTKNGTVFAPRPWFANGTTPEGLLLSEWLSLGTEQNTRSC